MNTKAPEKVFVGLRRFNIVMGFLHLLQGILMIVLSNDTTYPIFTNFLKFCSQFAKTHYTLPHSASLAPCTHPLC